MPTESTFFFAGLLFLAAGLGYFFARFGDLDDEDKHEAESTRFIRGFRYLLNEEPDRAVEAFTGGVEVNEEALDTQLALGALFRRRGELERAIRIHQNLLERPGLSPAQRDRAIYALAEDFLGAGLFDRAEELLHRLRESPPYRVEALGRLVRICEVTRDWERAVGLCADLRRLAPDAVSPVQLANYHCELAEQARAGGAPREAALHLETALATDPSSVRARLLAADLTLDAGRAEQATDAYRRLAVQEPTLIAELLPRLIKSGSASGPAPEALASLCQGSPEALDAMAVAVIRNPRIEDPGALAVLESWIGTDPVMASLVGRPEGTMAGPRPQLPRIREALHTLASAQPAYQCRSCGYQSATLQWQCPGCRSWETIRATSRLFSGPPRA